MPEHSQCTLEGWMESGKGMAGAGVMDLHPEERLPGLAGTKLLGWQDLGTGCSWGLGRE